MLSTLSRQDIRSIRKEAARMGPTPCERLFIIHDGSGDEEKIRRTEEVVRRYLPKAKKVS